MNSKFWACFDCGAFFRGSANQIDEFSSKHMCVRKVTVRENIAKIIKALQEISSLLPPPIAPPPPNFKNHQSQKSIKSKRTESVNSKKMDSVILQLKAKLK